MPGSAFSSYNFSVVIVQHPITKKFVVVNESRSRGLWLPAGYVESGESFEQAAHRECIEEAGIDIELQGIIRVEHSVSGKQARMRVVFFAAPKDLDAPLKSVADEESEGAFWAGLDEIEGFRFARKLRGDEIYVFAKYISDGGPVYPMSLLADESDDTVLPDPAVMYPTKHAT